MGNGADDEAGEYAVKHVGESWNEIFGEDSVRILVRSSVRKDFGRAAVVLSRALRI